ncbi:hypothetical protein DVH05_009895 [Phytophthora capsici]|nr:hypothetical protein DVH05_009895 [Phytophthora capsici]
MILKSCRKFAVFSLPARQKRSRDAVTESEKEDSERPQGRDQAKKARILESAAESTSSLLQQLISHSTEKHERVLAEMTRKNELRDEELAICLFETTPNSQETLRKKNLLQLAEQVRSLEAAQMLASVKIAAFGLSFLRALPL